MPGLFASMAVIDLRSTVLASCAKLIVFNYVGHGQCFHVQHTALLTVSELQQQADISCAPRNFVRPYIRR